jgi:hypothetical protein
MLRRTRVPLACAAALVAACADDKPPPAAPQDPTPPFHDFGTIPHGEARTHDFVIDTRALGEDFVCLGVKMECSCGRNQMLLRDRDGKERAITGQPLAEYAARAGEVLVIRVFVDSLQREAVDFGPVPAHAVAILQSVQNPDASKRRHVRMDFRYAVDSPVKLHPFAILDFETVPESATRELLTTLRSDIAGRRIRFGPATSSDARVAVELADEGELTTLRARFQPTAGQLGPCRVLVTVATDLPSGYAVRLAAVGKVVPDLEVSPYHKISLRCDLGRPQRQEEAQSQYVVLRDHDVRRTPEFIVRRIVDESGQDASKHFEANLTPIAGDLRGYRLTVRYLGGLAQGDPKRPGFRGEVVLAKDPEQGPCLPIELVAFHTAP